MSDNQAPQVPLPVSPGPVIIDNQTASKIDKPKSKFEIDSDAIAGQLTSFIIQAEDELAAESARLNDDSETAQGKNIQE